MPADEFFREKREWSQVKDGILRYYIDPYLRKVQARNKPILIVDTFAGPGMFGDGKEGSPLIIARTCEERVPGRYDAVFTNVEEDQHKELIANLNPYPNAHARFMPAREILEKLKERVKKQSLFLYLDPYGLDDCDFDLVKPLLDRTRSGDYSTELLLVFQMPYLHRQASRERVLEAYNQLLESSSDMPSYDDAIAQLGSEQQNKIKNVDRLMGGTYWRAIEYSDADEPIRAERLISAYIDKLSHPDKFGMSCPVNIDFEGTTKYYIVFISRHPDAAVFMNEAMLASTDKFYSFKAEIRDAHEPSLFGVGLEPWHQRRQSDRVRLKQLIPQYIAKHGPQISRSDLWFHIINDQFMRFSRSDFRIYIKELVAEGVLTAIIPPGKGINSDTILYLSSVQKIISV